MDDLFYSCELWKVCYVTQTKTLISKRFFLYIPFEMSHPRFLTEFIISNNADLNSFVFLRSASRSIFPTNPVIIRSFPLDTENRGRITSIVPLNFRWKKTFSFDIKESVLFLLPDPPLHIINNNSILSTWLKMQWTHSFISERQDCELVSFCSFSFSFNHSLILFHRY